MKINKKLKSVGKMQWVWLALQDGRYITRFWGYMRNINSLVYHKPILLLSVRQCFPLLRVCQLCKMNKIAWEWIDDKWEIIGEQKCCCIFRDIGGIKCIKEGANLLKWLEGGCIES